MDTLLIRHIVSSTISCFSMCGHNSRDYAKETANPFSFPPVDSTLRRLVHLQTSAAHRTQPTNLRIVESTESHQPPENILSQWRR
jgi:hypothetical protein